MRFRKEAKILVVGGAGFIGSYVAKKLLSCGYKNLIVFDNFSTGLRGSVPSGCTVIEGDLRRKEDLRLLPNDIDCVLHFAAATSVEESFKKPRSYLENNVLGTLNLFEWISGAGVKKVIYISSAAVYGDVDVTVTMSEDLEPAPINYYALTKLDGEHITQIWHKNFGLDFAIARYFNVFGDGQECSSAYASVIPKFIYAAMRGEDLTIYGTGEQTRDFIHVDETAEATILIMEKGEGVYNVAAQQQYDINTIARLIIEYIKTKSRIVYLPPIPGDSMRDNSCNKKLVELGWSRKYQFEHWLQETIKWYQEWFKTQKAEVVNG